MYDGSESGARILQLMEAALELLDEGRYPADIGAHLDMALHRFREHQAVSTNAQRPSEGMKSSDITL